MKHQDAERRVPRCNTAAIPFFYNYPKFALAQKSRDAAYERAFYAPGFDAPGGYAENTTTWD